ncbi:hypothetical protein KC19_7G042200 [Ceratodon purpureus]|uniref:MMS19 nucleotide excision repair protein n=1 Tax=Ceratodon purpureus TaxID=3225 RepID=A0A8T0HAK9_CERPU|nr:hypothetical protein KC19_7G042200 [Ceratodon purpureus]
MASATLESLIESYVDSQRPAAQQASSAKAISKEVLEGRLTIQSLVLTLGTYLTTTDNIVRARGTLLLSDILDDLSQKPLEDTAIKSITNFYSARLGDWHCLRGAVLGSLSLLRRKSNVGAVEIEEAREVAKSALANLHVQALAQRDRMICLELFECLLEKHADAVAPLEGDLVFGIVAAVEEEKDPRCLLLAFRIIQLLARLYPDPNGPIASCADELFDVVSRYFPISFNPQPNNPDGITREDLATALKEAFACTPIFAPFCIPLLLEKLSSSLRRAKLDALNYLGYCGLVYGAKVLSEYTVSVWEALKTELLPLSVPSSSTSLEPQDVEIVKEALTCLRSWVLVFQIEKDLSLESGDFLRLIQQDGIVEDLITCLKNDTESRGHPESAMKDRGKYQAEAAGRVLAESTQASPSSCFLICKQVLTQVMTAAGLVVDEEFLTNQDRDRSRSVIGLDIVLHIVVAARSLAEKVFLEHGQSAAITSKKWLNPLREQSENLIGAFHQAITDKWSKDSSVLGVAGLQALASFPASFSPLSSDQLRRILLILKDLLIDGTEEKLLTNVFTALERISSVEQRSGTMDGDVGILTVVVPDLLRVVREATKSTTVGKPLQVLAKICGPRSVARQLVITHLTESVHLDLSGVKGNEELDEICAKLVVVLQCLSEDILPWCDGQSADQSVTMELSMEIWTIVSTDAVKCSQEVLEWSLKAMRGAVSKCDATVQSKILHKGVKLLFDTSPHHEGEMDWSVALLASVIVSLRPSTIVPNKQSLLTLLMRAAQSQKPLLVTETAAQAVASMLNKWVVASANEADRFTLDKAVNMALGEGCLSLITSNSVPDNLEETGLGRDVSKVSGVRAAAWIGKGLAMRGHNGVSDVASILLRLLLSGASKEEESCSLAMAAAEGLGIILKDSDVCLNKAHHAVIRPLYKQRFFSSMLKPLLEAVRSSSDTHVKLWLYRGLGHLISGTPHVALLADGAKVFPVILGTLLFLYSDPSDSDLLLSTLLALSAFLVDVHQGRSVAGEHVSSIVKRMLTLIQYQYSVVVRETALQCLGAVVGLPYTRVYPLRTEVLKALSAALDDRKRVVRKEAVRCRQAWTLIASK